MEYAKQARLINGPIGLTLFRLTIPMLFGTIGMVAFNLIDTFFVGQLGTRELAAMSFTFPVVLSIGSMNMGIGVGAAATISRAIGQGDHSRVRRLTTDSLMLALLVAGVMVVVGLFTIDALFGLLGAPPEILPFIREYMTIWYVGVVLISVPMVGNNIIRATGDTKTPGTIMLVVVVNGLLDPLLIFGIGPFPRLELAGAAIATLVARSITMVVALWVLIVRERMITFARPSVSDVLASWKEVLYIGIPTAGTNVIMPLTMGIITTLVSGYGPSAVAAFGTASRLDMFALTVVIALSTVLAPFVGQNWGAGKYDRVETAVTYSYWFVLAWGLSLFLLLMIVAMPVASLFTDAPEVIAIIVLYLSIVPLGYGFHGVVQLSNSVLNVLRRPFYAAALSIIQMFVLYIPLAYLGSALFGLTGIFGGAAIAYVVTGTGAYFLLKRIVLRQIRVEGGIPVAGERV